MQEFGGNWTEEKLVVMRNYFQAYTVALKKQPFRKYYVDAFAGSGSRVEKSTREEESNFFGEDFEDFVKVKNGSVRVALSIEPKFDRYIFADLSDKNVAALEELKLEFSDRNIEIEVNNANDFLKKFAEKTNWKTSCAAVFIDPFGMQVDWSALAALANTRAVDIALLFPTGPLNRMLARNGKIPDNWATRIDAHLGPCDWREQMYQRIVKRDLFSDIIEFDEKHVTAEGLRDFVASRLRDIFPHVCDHALELRNSKNSILYHLFITCANLSPVAGGLAMRIAKSAIAKTRRR
ncbi:MAG: three-Cys-motif partner protein TcmP [Alphaproteobacteria bacterium]|nr:three-Cys-motif partner protein TcmP [Alphaproteobacteria bacterium]